MSYFKKNIFTLREEYLCHVLVVLCLIMAALPGFICRRSNSSPSASESEKACYLTFYDCHYPLLINLLVFLLDIATFYTAFVILKQYLTIRDNPISKIHSAAQGYVEVEGIQHILPNVTLKSPLSNTTCSWYSYLVEEKKHSSRGVVIGIK